MVYLTLLVLFAVFLFFSLSDIRLFSDAWVELRLLRFFSILITGICLGISGSVFQSVTQNPIADSYTLGVSGGASLGAALALGLGVGLQEISFLAGSFFGALCSVLLLLALVRNMDLADSNRLLLVGFSLSLICGAFVSMIMMVLSAADLQKSYYWMAGQFGTWRDGLAIYLWAPVLMTTLLLSGLSRKLDVLSLGSDFVRACKLRPEKIVRHALLLGSLLVCFAVSLCGVMAFVGIVSPHLARRISLRYSHRDHFVYASFISVLLLLLSDCIAQSLFYPREIPTGAIVAVLAGPALIIQIAMQYSRFSKRNVGL